MTVTFYTLRKKVNSTATPSGGVSLDCQIFEPCSVTSPVIILAGEDPEKWNYARIPAWARYYWIRSWERREGLWYGYLDVDVLATYKDTIGRSTQYITRATARHDGSVTDTAYTTKGPPLYNYQTQPSPWDLVNGTYVIGVGGGRTTFYALSTAQFNALIAYIFSDGYADELVGGIWSDVYPELKARLNPLQYISSVTWFPLTIGGNPVSSIPVGWVNCPVSGSRLPAFAVTHVTVSFTIPKHPQSGSRGIYLNSPPYSQYHLFFPPWGVFQLGSDFCAAHSSFDARVVIDCKTGFANLKIENGQVQDCIIQTKIGVPIQLAQITAPGTGLLSITRDTLQVAQGVASTVGAALQGNAAGAVGAGLGALDTALGAIGSIAENKIPSINSIGSSGGMGGLGGVPTLISMFYQVVADDIANQGAPLCQMARVDTLPGYQMVGNPHLEIDGLPGEAEQICNYMRGGYYYD